MGKTSPMSFQNPSATWMKTENWYLRIPVFMLYQTVLLEEQDTLLKTVPMIIRFTFPRRHRRASFYSLMTATKFTLAQRQIKKAKAGELEPLTDDGHSYQALSYENAFGRNTSLRYSAQLNGSKEEIILDKKPKNNTFSFTLKTENAIAAINSYGDVEIIDTTSGNIVDTLSAPFAYDSSGGFDSTSEHYTDCTYTLEEQQTQNTAGATTYTLTITVPEDYLSADTTEYPVIIDPTSSNLSMRFDTALYSGKPTIASGANATANFGRSPSYGYGWAMFYFLLPSGLKSYANINSAKLYVRETTGSTSNIVCYAEDFLIVYFLLAIVVAAGFVLWAKKKQLSESNRYLYMIVPLGLAILALASVMRVWTAAVFFLIILFGGYGVMLTSMAKHREDIQLTPKQIWGSAGIAFVVMFLLRLVEYLVFKM